MGLKQFLSFKSLFLFIVLLSVGFFIYQTNTSNLTSERKTVDTRAAGAATVKIMTFNVLGEPLCAQGRDHRGDMRAIVDFVKNNGISIANLQEVKESHDDDDDGCEYDLLSNIEDEVAARASTYRNFSREYISADQGSASSKWYRMFLYNIPRIGVVETSSVASSNSQGAEAIVVNTSLGPIRFINLHPQPGTQGLTVHNMLVPFVNQFKGDGIPMVIMGDFNLNYDLSNAAPVLKAIEDAGFYRACDPATFPNGRCNDTVKGSSNFAVDHIFIDKRASFRVKNAYVEQSMQFSDHLPVVVELEEAVVQTAELPNPTGLAYTCNTNGTATFRWNAVSGAREYGFRLDRQPPYDWYNAALDTVRNTSSTTITVPALSGVQYQWAVTAVTTPGSPHGLPTWQPAFTCTASAPTTTPFIQLQAKNPQGQPVVVPGMSYTYNCGSYAQCFTIPKQNTSSYTVYSIGTWEGGGGIVLQSNQRLLGVTPVPVGGAQKLNVNNNRDAGNPSVWFNWANWQNYWWPKYPSTGSYRVDFIVATITPIPTTRPTSTPTRSPTVIPTRTPTPTITRTPTSIPTGTSTRTPTPTRVLVCNDTDGGLTYGTRGSVTGTGSGCGTVAAVDLCANGQVLNEMHCGSSKQCFTSAYTCPNGCRDGACIAGPTGGATVTRLPDCAQRSKGDSNCDGRVDMVDYACWRSEFITRQISPNCKTSDYDGRDGVGILDFAIWKATFVRVLP